jgi:hypothetical protein
MYRNAQKFHFVHGAPACAKTSYRFQTNLNQD